MNQGELYQMLSDLRSKIDIQSVDNAYIKSSIDKIEKIINEEFDDVNNKILAIDNRCGVIEREKNSKMFLNSILSYLFKYSSPIIFAYFLFCVYQGFHHIKDFHMLNFN